jgi:FkbH-like protein
MSDRIFKDLGFPAHSFSDILNWRASHQPYDTAYTFLVDGEETTETITYAQLAAKARAIGAMLIRNNARMERILLVFEPGLEYIEAFYGCLVAGCIAVPSYPPLSKRLKPRFESIIKDSGATIALTTTTVLRKIEDRLGIIKNSNVSWVTIDNLADDNEDLHGIAVDPRSVCFLQYTSGSTGAPKGVMVTNGNLLNNSSVIQEKFGHTRESSAVIWLPPYHDMGLIGGILQPMYVGFPVTIMSPFDFVQRPFRWLKAISKYGASTSGAPNFAYDLCISRTSLEEKATLDLSKWCTAFTGAEPINTDTITRFSNTFQEVGFDRGSFYPCYGLAEATLFVSGGYIKDVMADDSSDQSNNLSRTIVGCGTVGTEHNIIIVDPDSRMRKEFGSVGEIWVSGPSVTAGYWHNPNESDVFDAFVADTGEGPFLRTGDLGFVQNCQLFVTGRIKDLIIVRGRNLYPQDIEWSIQDSFSFLVRGGGAAFATDDEQEGIIIVQEIHRHARKTDFSPVAYEIRRLIAELYQVHVRDITFVNHGSLPKTSSGKIQRHLIRESYFAGTLPKVDSYLLDRANPIRCDAISLSNIDSLSPTEMEEVINGYLVALLSDVTSISNNSFDINTPLISLGLDSLQAYELKGILDQKFDVQVPIELVIGGWNLQQLSIFLCERVKAQTDNHVDETLPKEIVAKQLVRLTEDQERLWMMDQLTTTMNVVPFAVMLKGTLDICLLERCLNIVISRHDALRARITVDKGVPYQEFRSELTVDITKLVVTGTTDEDREEAIREVLENYVKKPFELEHSLIRALLVSVTDEKHIFLLTTHHLVSDLRSMEIIMSELFDIYKCTLESGESFTPPARPFQFSSYVIGRESQVAFQPTVAYWNKTLQALEVLRLPTAVDRLKVKDKRSSTDMFHIPQGLVSRLNELSVNEGTTIFMTLLTAFKLLLFLHTGQTNITVGVPVTGRGESRLKNAVGFFASPLPIRTDIHPSLPLSTLMAKVKESVLNTLKNSNISITTLVKSVQFNREPGFSPLFQTMFSYYSSAFNGGRINEELSFELMNVTPPTIDVDLYLTVFNEGEKYRGVLTYNGSLFDQNVISKLIQDYVTILSVMAQSTCQSLKEIELFRNTNLLSSKCDDGKMSVYVVSTFTSEPIQEAIEFWLNELNVSSTIQFGPYSQVFQQLIQPSSVLRQNPGVNVILIRLMDWVTENGTIANCDVAGELRHVCKNFLTSLEKAAQSNASALYSVVVCPSRDTHAFEDCQAEIEQLIAEHCSRVSNVTCLLPQDVLSKYSVPDIYDVHSDEFAALPYTPEFYTVLGTTVARSIYSRYSKKHKVIVVDCDNTLWTGAVAEEGAAGVIIDEYRKEFQRFLVRKQEEGVLICLCSKNVQYDVQSVFDCRPDMPLRWGHLTSVRINWNPKSKNIKSLAEELGLGLDSFVFMDDSAIECAEVTSECPQVLVIKLPQETYHLRDVFNHIWSLDSYKVTEEDRNRNSFYRADIKRANARNNAESFEKFLAELQLEINVSNMTRTDIKRVTQLSQRTNQFNFRPLPQDEATLAETFSTNRSQYLVVKVKDRFGDYGLVGAIAYERLDTTLMVNTFMLSCRALGRGVEHAIVKELAQIAQSDSMNSLCFRFLRTERNIPAFDFINAIGEPIWNSGKETLFRVGLEKALGLKFTLFHDNVRNEPVVSKEATLETYRNEWTFTNGTRPLELFDPRSLYSVIKSRRSHQLPKTSGENCVMPTTPLEQSIASIWEDTLGIPQVSVNDDFFRIGGNSLMATRVISRIKDLVSCDIPMSELFSTSFTISSLAASVEEYQIRQLDLVRVSQFIEELESLSDGEVIRLLSEQQKNQP